jgi:hypothetical protein
MAIVYKHVMSTDDFFDSMLELNEDTDEWESYLDGVTKRAAKSSGTFSYTDFEMFLYNHGYSDRIGDVLDEAMRAFTNECINDDKADFDYC